MSFCVRSRVMILGRRTRTTTSHTHVAAAAMSDGRRAFSVQQLSWCSPKGAPSKKVSDDQYRELEECNDNHHDPIDRFGVVAAMSRNLVIGMDGKIPWRVPQDRALFKQLTRDKILIVGRNTFEEAPNQCHIDHTRYCIVVSNSLETLEDKNVDDGIDRLKLARSFKEALDQAKKLSEHLPTTNLETTEDDGLVCWVAGGENIYEEAIRHPSAKELHLSTIDLEIDIRRGVARFPAKHRWDNKYTILSTNRFHEPKESDTPAFSYSIWKRKTRGGR